MDVIANLLSPIFEWLQGWQDIAFIFWVCWAVYVFWGLKNDSDDRSRFIGGMQNGLSNTYHKKLEDFLEWTAKGWFKDHNVLIKRRLGETTQSHWRTKLFGIDAFTSSSYDFNLRLALIYPLVAVFSVWAITGLSGEVGEIIVFPAEESLTRRFTIVVGMLLMAWSLYKFFMTDSWKSYLYLAVAIAVAVAGDFAGDFAVAGAVTVAVAFAGAFAGAFAFAGAVAFTGAFTGAVGVAVAGAVAVAVAIPWVWLYERHKNTQLISVYWFCFSLFYCCLIVLALVWLANQSDIKYSSFSWLIFLSLLPLLNVPVDWLSLGITRSLLYAIADKVHSGYRAFFWALADILIAILFLFLITLLVVLAISTVNGLAIGTGGVRVLNLPMVFEGLSGKSALAEQNWWIYIMLFSTLVPTAVHLFIASWSVLLWFPTRLVDWATGGWRHEQLKKDAAKFFSVWLYWVVFAPLALFAPLLMFYAVYLVLHDWGHGYYLGGKLLVFMQKLSLDVTTVAESFAASFTRN